MLQGGGVPDDPKGNITEQIAKNVGVDAYIDPSFEGITLDLKQFNNLELVIKRRVILYTINELLGSTEGIEKINIDDIIKLCNNNIGNKYLMPIKYLKILVKKGKIFFEAVK